MSSFLASMLLLSSISLSSASPLYIIKPTSIVKRNLTTGTKAGLGVGIAVVVILVVLIVTFFTIHFRHKAARRSENAAYTSEKQFAGVIPPPTKGSFDGTLHATSGEPGPQVATMPRRQKSVKDRLMGPLYRDSTYDMVSMPNKAKLAGQENRTSAMMMEEPAFLNKPWATKRDNVDNRASYSSKRATRMMMMM